MHCPALLWEAHVLLKNLKTTKSMPFSVVPLGMGMCTRIGEKTQLCTVRLCRNLDFLPLEFVLGGWRYVKLVLSCCWASAKLHWRSYSATYSSYKGCHTGYVSTMLACTDCCSPFVLWTTSFNSRRIHTFTAHLAWGQLLPAGTQFLIYERWEL